MRLRKILRRTLWTVIALATLILFLYAAENWRGARALRAAEREYQSVGSLNFADFVPPTIRAAENLAALPIFTPTHDPESKRLLRPLKLEAAMKVHQELPSLGSGQLGQLPDLKLIRVAVESMFKEAFGKKPDSKSALIQLDAIYPIITELSRASEARTKCRFDFDYANPLVLMRSFALLTDMIPLSRLITLHAVLALNENQPEVALRDLRTMLLLRSGVAHDPSIVAHLVAIGMSAISDVVIIDGLALHAWSDVQLVQLEHELATIDYLSGYRFARQGELAAQMHDLPTVRDNLTRLSFKFRLVQDVEDHQPVNFAAPWPAGWLNQGAARLIRFDSENLQALDLVSRRVYPDRISLLNAQRERIFLQRKYILPWNFFFAEGSMGTDTVLRNSARAQTWVDHSVLACALERYRLAFDRYPDFLSALAPTFLQSIPHDVINGQPYHYVLKPDGSYLLYSVGWNEKEDGGTVVFDKDDPRHHRIDYDQGDWVWFGAK